MVPHEGNADATVKREFKKFAKAFGVNVSDDAGTDETIAEIAAVYNSAKKDLSNRENPVIKQKRIKEKELDNYLEQGWQIHTTLPSGDLVIKH